METAEDRLSGGEVGEGTMMLRLSVGVELDPSRPLVPSVGEFCMKHMVKLVNCKVDCDQAKL